MPKSEQGPRVALKRAFAEQLRWALDERRLSATDLAMRLGTTPMSVRSYLRGDYTPKPSILGRIEAELGVRFILDATATRPEAGEAANAARSETPSPHASGLTIAQAKAALAATYGIPEARIEIILRG